MDALDAIDRLAAGDLRGDDAIARPIFTVAEPQLRRFALSYTSRGQE